MLRVHLVFWYIICCLRIGARPWRYFQLNAPWFNNQKHLFSKLEMDELIPEKWRLAQEILHSDSQPCSWPVFLKPEWGQNAKGILLAENQHSFDDARQALLSGKIPYMYQKAAHNNREFEVFYIRKKASSDEASVFSITETLNASKQVWPVNSILNRHTSHKTLTQLTGQNQQQLWQYMNELPAFRIARIGLRAKDIENMLQGNYQIIEINLYVPMPLYLLDATIPLGERHAFIRSSMLQLAQLTKSVPLKQPRKNVFWPMLFLNYRIRL